MILECLLFVVIIKGIYITETADAAIIYMYNLSKYTMDHYSSGMPASSGVSPPHGVVSPLRRL